MGKSTSLKSTVQAGPVSPEPIPSHSSPGLLRSVCEVSTPTPAADKLACSHALDATQPSSPSSLISSSPRLPSICYTAGPSSFSYSPFGPLAGPTIVDPDNIQDKLLPQPHQPIRANVQQIPSSEFDGAPKGRTGAGRTSSRYTTYSPMPPTNFAPINHARGSSRPTASPAAFQASGLARSLQESLAQWTYVRQPVRKALLVGINYVHLGEGKRLWHAARDASRFGGSLKTSGFRPENIRRISEEPGSELPTFATLKRHMDWLVCGAQKGDALFFMFSGHCVKNRGLLTLDGHFISREALHNELVLRVPAGCELQIVFDCCNAASMVPLQYCVGRMAPPSEEPSEPQQPECDPETDPRSSDLGSGVPPRSDPLIASLDGFDAVSPAPSTPDVTPDMVDLPSFAPPTSQRQRGGVIAAPPVEQAAAQPGTVAERATGLVASWLGFGQTTTEASAAPVQASGGVATGTSAPGKAWRGRHVVVEGERVPDYFEERKEGYLKPAGNVVVWAGTGEEQQAFEAYGNVKHGIVTNAICGALEACIDSKLTRRDLWRYLVGEIDKENVHRGKRDAKKGESERQDPRLRVQHAELWVSQAQPLESSAAVLDQLVFSAA